MRNKDQITLEEKYLQTRGILKEQSENQFTSEVDLDVYAEPIGETAHVNHPKKINVRYNIEVDFRSYGIKEINVSFVSADSFSAELVKWGEDDDDVSNFEVDLSSLQNVETEFNVGQYGQVFPTSLEVKLGQDLKPVSAKLIF